MKMAPIFFSLSLLVACGKSDSNDDTGDVVDADGDGFVASVDCDDNNAAVNPDAEELCDDEGVDENCNGLSNDADDSFAEGTRATFYLDADGDGFGDANAETLACENPSTATEAYTEDSTDCNDADAAVNPGAQEVCDADDVDENCDGLADDAQADTDESTMSIWYADTDGDGFGDVSVTALFCDLSAGYSADSTDCDDSNSEIHPQAAEVCDGIDNDCDASTIEDNMARFVDDSGNVTDYTSIGTAAAPDTSAPSAAGSLTLCDGTFYMNWNLENDLTVTSISGDATASVIDGAAVGSVMVLGNYPDYGSGYSAALDVSNVTITNGNALSEYYQLAGGISCADLAVDSTVTLDNVIFQGNDGTGNSGPSAVFTYSCDLSLSNSELTGNIGHYGTVYFQYTGDLLISDTVFDSNQVIDGGGASALVLQGNGAYTQELNMVDFYGNEAADGDWGGGTISVTGESTPVFDDVAVYDNTHGGSGSSATSGVILYHGTDLLWSGSSSASSGIWSNEDSGPGLWFAYSSSSITAEVVDFGGSSANNAEYDIDYSSSAGSAYYAPDDASFVCNNYRCGDDADGDGDASNDESTCETGGMDVPYASYVDMLWGSIYLADTSATIESFDAYVETNSGCTMDWYVLSTTSTPSTGTNWTVEWADTNNSLSTTSAGWQNSGHIGLPVESGTYYALAFNSDCVDFDDRTVGHYAYTTDSLTDGGFGDAVGYVLSTSSADDQAVGDSLSTSYCEYNSTVLLSFRPHVTDLDAPSTGVCP